MKNEVFAYTSVCCGARAEKPPCVKPKAVKAKGKKRAVAKVVAVVAKVDASDTAASPARQRGVAHERDAALFRRP